MFTFTLPASLPPQPVSQLLRSLKFSLTMRRKLKQAEQAILVNGQISCWQQVVFPGDLISICWPANCRVQPLPLPLTIVFEDDFLLVVNKPAGQLVHPTTDPTLTSLANGVVWHLQASGYQACFHPVQRLDRNTSGLLLIAKNPHIQHLLSSDTGLRLQRTYLALATGIIRPGVDVISAPIGRHPDSIIQRRVHPDGQPAVTHYKLLQEVGDNSLVALRLETGRTHQIRVHLASIGHPLLGDDLYGGSTQLIGRQALHAEGLAFTHPLTREKFHLSCPLPEDMAQLITTLHEAEKENDLFLFR
jgi:23S rRNA pseudouridine1911/1915/1917 synthase